MDSWTKYYHTAYFLIHFPGFHCVFILCKKSSLVYFFYARKWLGWCCFLYRPSDRCAGACPQSLSYLSDFQAFGRVSNQGIALPVEYFHLKPSGTILSLLLRYLFFVLESLSLSLGSERHKVRLGRDLSGCDNVLFYACFQSLFKETQG